MSSRSPLKSSMFVVCGITVLSGSRAIGVSPCTSCITLFHHRLINMTRKMTPIMRKIITPTNTITGVYSRYWETQDCYYQ